MPGGVPGLVHPFAAGGAYGDDAGSREAAVPPVVESMGAHRLAVKTVDFAPRCLSRLGVECLWDRLLSRQEVMVRLRLRLQDQPL